MQLVHYMYVWVGGSECVCVLNIGKACLSVCLCMLGVFVSLWYGACTWLVGGVCGNANAFLSFFGCKSNYFIGYTQILLLQLE